MADKAGDEEYEGAGGGKLRPVRAKPGAGGEASPKFNQTGGAGREFFRRRRGTGGNNMSIFEAIMMISFGAAWPLNICKSYKTRSAVGKSVFFLYVVNIGYLSGIIHKILVNFDYVIFLYILNFGMVSIDIILYYRNRRLDRQREAALARY